MILAVMLGGSAMVVNDQPKYDWPKTLSEWQLFEGVSSNLEPAEDVYDYDVNSALFSDYAFKRRQFAIPQGEQMIFSEDEPFFFAVTITFRVPLRYSWATS